MVNNGLRERKRAATRQRVSDCATRLFERDGFENVTLAQVAQAADVSVKTGTNYFGAKEDLFFDAEPAILEALVDALRERAAASPTSALRPLVLNGPVLTAPRPWAGVDTASWDGMRVWSRCDTTRRRCGRGVRRFFSRGRTRWRRPQDRCRGRL